MSRPCQRRLGVGGGGTALIKVSEPFQARNATLPKAEPGLKCAPCRSRTIFTARASREAMPAARMSVEREMMVRRRSESPQILDFVPEVRGDMVTTRYKLTRSRLVRSSSYRVRADHCKVLHSQPYLDSNPISFMHSTFLVDDLLRTQTKANIATIQI